MIKKISFILCLIFSIFLLYSCNTTSNKDIVDIKVISIPDQIEIGKFDNVSNDSPSREDLLLDYARTKVVR